MLQIKLCFKIRVKLHDCSEDFKFALISIAFSDFLTLQYYICKSLTLFL